MCAPRARSGLAEGRYRIWPAILLAQELKTVQLPTPQMDGGKPLMRALKERASARAFSPEKLLPQVLSNLLWAAVGVNRPEKGGRTAPSANNSQDMGVYVAMGDGLFLYCASEGLTTVVRALIDRPALAKAMMLGPDQKIILAQTVGYPKQ